MMSSSNNGSFTKVLPGEYDAAALMKYVQGGGVALMVRAYPSTMTCEVTSYAYNARGQLYVYSPSHYLATTGCLGENPAEATSVEEWRAKYSGKGSWISIDNEFYGRSDYAKDIFQFREIMQRIERSNTNSTVELYISKHHWDFHGPLEIEMMKYWLDNHQEYICGNLVK